jgi:ADP-heptose:LPS heptosyltransferase
VIKRDAAFGDVLIAAAVAPALKKKHPGASIIFNTNCHEVLKDNPFIDRVVFEEQISERSFQILYNLNFAYEYKPTTNILQAYAESVGVNRSDCSLFLKTEPIEGLPENFIVVHAGKTAWVGRDWSPMKFDVLAKRLRKDDYKVVCVGTGYDHLVSSDLDLRGKTSVNQLAYVMQKATAFVGIDSFPMHVTQVFDVPGVCFFGSIKPETRIISNKMIPVVAQGISCLGCHHKQPAPCTVTNQCETVTQDCINLVGIDQMFKKVKMILEMDKNG